jgi:hypothetical protein
MDAPVWASIHRSLVYSGEFNFFLFFGYPHPFNTISAVFLSSQMYFKIYQFPILIFLRLHGNRESLSMSLNYNFFASRALRHRINSLVLYFFYSMGIETTDRCPFHPFFLLHGNWKLLSIPLNSNFSTSRALRHCRYALELPFFLLNVGRQAYSFSLGKMKAKHQDAFSKNHEMIFLYLLDYSAFLLFYTWNPTDLIWIF